MFPFSACGKVLLVTCRVHPLDVLGKEPYGSAENVPSQQSSNDWNLILDCQFPIIIIFGRFFLIMISEAFTAVLVLPFTY